MKKYSYILILLLLIGIACKESQKEKKSEELPILEKLAYAHGYGEWDKVTELQFTFNVDRDTSHFERTWIWKPKTNEVTAISASDTISYQRKAMDSISQKINAGFINDKYWLLAPINILWDKANLQIEHVKDVEAPISQKPMQKLTVVYGAEGGYTPGDAYDFYFGEDFLIREWVFRKGNQPDPSMTTTWEDYMNSNGLKIARKHQNKEGNLLLYFTNVATKTE